MSWLVITLGVIGFVELLRRLPLLQQLQQLACYGSRAISVVRSTAISDHWKEKALLAYAGRIFVSSMGSFLYFLLALAPLILAAAIATAIHIPVLELLYSPQGIAGATVIAALYLWLRSLYLRRLLLRNRLVKPQL